MSEEFMENQPAEKPALSTKQKVLKELREWLAALVFALVLVLIIRTFLFTIIRVDGTSMDTTLHDGERLVVTVLDKKIKGVERGDVVICHYPDRYDQYWFIEMPTNFVKRVVAVPGDTVSQVNGVTYVNGEALDGNGSVYYYNVQMRDEVDFTRVLGEDEYYVVGDNRYNSHDSRSSDVGAISSDMIVGKVRLVMWPLSSIRVVE